MNRLVTTEETLENPELSEHAAEAAGLQGKRLDEARAEFRAEWAGKVERIRRRAAWTRMRGASLNRLARDVRVAALVLGALVGTVNLLGAHDFRTILGVFVGALLGLIGVTPLVFWIDGSARSSNLRAERLDRSARDLERQVDASTPLNGHAHSDEATAADGESLSEPGDQSFEEARAEFRAAWRARLTGK